MKSFTLALFFTAAYPALAEEVKIEEGKKQMKAEVAKPEKAAKAEAPSNVLKSGKEVKTEEGKKPMEAEVAKPENTAKAEVPSNVLQVGVKGMVCAFCAQGIEKQFKAQNEVKEIEVSLENSYVRITFKDGQRLSQETIAKLLKDAGYESSFGA